MQNKPLTKSQLAIRLSRLKVFEGPDERQEQYPTDSEIAAEVLSFASMQGDIEGKKVMDLGCGTGILGIGCLLLGAMHCTFVDNDPKALKVLRQNLRGPFIFNIENKSAVVEQDIADVEGAIVEGKSDVVMQNPPFGTRKKHVDVLFLRKAFELAPVVYSFHKTSTMGHIRKTAEKQGFRVTHALDFDFPLKATLKHHERRIHRVGVTAARFTKLF